MAAPETWRLPSVVVRSQIVENCSFFSPPGAQLSVILTREPLGTYKAIVLRAEFGSQREVVLSSESADTVNRAFELLLIKSADAVQNYITTNGFAFAFSSKKVEDVVDIDEDDEDDEDDGVSSVSSSVLVDDDPAKNLEDSTLSLSEVESAYESLSEDGIDARYSRARAPHNTSSPRNTTTTPHLHHAYPTRVRRSRSPRRPDDPGYPREGARQQRTSPPPPPRYPPYHNFPVHRRRPTSPVRLSPNPNGTAVLNGLLGGGRHMPPPPIVVVGGGAAAAGPGAGAPPAPPSLRGVVGNGGGGSGAWRHSPGGAIPLPVMHAGNSAVHNVDVQTDHPAGPLRLHPSQYFSLHQPPPPPRMTLGSIQQPPTAGAMQQQQQQLYPHGKPPVGINRDLNNNSNTINNNNGLSPTGISMHHAMSAGPTVQAGGSVPPPPPSTTSSLSLTSSSSSSTPTLTASPNKPPFPPPTPATIDCRLCIRSRSPGAPQQDSSGAGTQQAQGDYNRHQQSQWHEQRIILRAPPTRAHIRGAALRFVEFNPDKFRHLGGGFGGGGGNNNTVNNNINGNNNTPSFRPLEFWNGAITANNNGGGGGDGRQQQHQLRAALTRAVFGGGESYDLSTYAEDDLSRLCAGMCAAGQGPLPLFEVTVSNVGPAGSFFTLS